MLTSGQQTSPGGGIWLSDLTFNPHGRGGLTQQHAGVPGHLPGGGCIRTWWQRRCQWRCSEIKSISIQLQKQPSTPSVKWQQRVSHACLHRNMFMVGGWWSVEFLSPIKCDKSGPKSYCDDSRLSREIRFENLDKIWIRQVIVYQLCVLTGEKKTASYLWIFGYTWLILILFLHYANL